MPEQGTTLNNRSFPITGGRRPRGFTLVELVIALSILGILVAVAAPSFQGIMQDTKQVSAYNKFNSALRLGRAEATKRSSPITLCARDTDTACGTDWGKGWIMFTDSTAIAGSNELSLDSTDTIIKLWRNDSDTIDITARAIIRPANMATQSTILFTSRGRSNWDMGTFVICDGRGAKNARAMAVGGGGMVRKLESDSGTAPPDAVGTPVTCP